MKKMTIYRHITNCNGIPVDKEVLRVVTPSLSFEGYTESGQINPHAWKELADALEPGNDGFDIL